MPSMSRTLDQQLEHSKQIMFGTSVYSQPWWGNNISFSNGDVRHGQDQKHLKDTPPPKPPSTDEQFQMNSQMELVGHSIVLTSSLYSDPQCGGLLNSLGPGSMVQQLYGMHHARIPLPLEMEEEPVYVNPKQYHGILRRRQSRAKAELEQKVLKARKPYLHESRHQHAMRRPRGSGGRFLNKKKLDSNASSDEAGNSSNDLSLQSPNLSISQIEDSTEDMLEIHARANGHGFSRVQLVDLNGLRGGPHGPTHNN